jgi:hypothetical protein
MQTCVTNLHHRVTKDVWEIQFNEIVQLDKSKNDQTVDKQYMKANPNSIKFKDISIHKIPCWVYIEPRWILKTHPSIKQHIIAHVKRLVLVDIHQQLTPFGPVPY